MNSNTMAVAIPQHIQDNIALIQAGHDFSSPSTWKGIKELKKLARTGVHCYPMRPLSYSSLKAYVSGSILGYLDYVTDSPEPSPAMKRGTLFESLLMGQKWEEIFVVWEKPFPGSNMNKKENKEALTVAKEKAEFFGMEVIEKAEFEKVKATQEAALNHPFWKSIRRRYKINSPEKKVFREPITGLKITGIPDLDVRRRKTGIDIKNGQSIALWKKRLSDKKDCLWLQAGMYGLIYGYEDFYFFTNKTKGKPMARAFYIDPETMERMKQKTLSVLHRFRQDLIKGFGLYEEKVELPEWFDAQVFI